MQIASGHSWLCFFTRMMTRFPPQAAHLLRASRGITSQFASFFRNMQLSQYHLHQLVDQPPVRGRPRRQQEWNHYSRTETSRVLLLRELHRTRQLPHRLRLHSHGTSREETRAPAVQEKLRGDNRAAFSGLRVHGPDPVLGQLRVCPVCPVARARAHHHWRRKRNRCHFGDDVAGVLLSNLVSVHCHAVGL